MSKRVIYAVVLVAIILASTLILAHTQQAKVNPQEQTVTTPITQTDPTPETILLQNSTPPDNDNDIPIVEPQIQQATPIPSNNPTTTNTPANNKDISYGENPLQKFDLYLQENASKPKPLVILMHGGSWVGGDKSDLSALANLLVNEGYVVINMNYRVLPESYPEPMEDIQMVLKWVSENVQTTKVDLAHIGLVGYSAGAHLAALYALTQNESYIAKDSALPKIAVTVAFAGCYTLQDPHNASAISDNTILAWLQTAHPQSQGMPINQIDSTDHVRFLLMHGAKDTVLPPSQSTLFCQALKEANIAVQLQIYQDRDHASLISGLPTRDSVANDLLYYLGITLQGEWFYA